MELGLPRVFRRDTIQPKRQLSGRPWPCFGWGGTLSWVHWARPDGLWTSTDDGRGRSAGHHEFRPRGGPEHTPQSPTPGESLVELRVSPWVTSAQWTSEFPTDSQGTTSWRGLMWGRQQTAILSPWMSPQTRAQVDPSGVLRIPEGSPLPWLWIRRVLPPSPAGGVRTCLGSHSIRGAWAGLGGSKHRPTLESSAGFLQNATTCATYIWNIFTQQTAVVKICLSHKRWTKSHWQWH